MKIVRWLLGHSFLILLIVAVIYGYMFWGNLAGENTPAGKALAYLSNEFVEVEQFVNAVKAKQAQLSGKQTSENKNDYTASVDKANDNSAQSNSAEPVNKSIGQQPASISYSNNQAQVKPDSAAAMASVVEKMHDDKAIIANNAVKQNNDLPLTNSQGRATVNNAQLATNTVAIGGAKDTFVSPEIEKQLSNVDGQGKVVNESQQSDAIRVIWITARKSFYQRNYELSEQSYQKVIDNTEDNFDAYGELGNVYFNQGKNEQAASAYFEAAAILVRKGQVRRAQSLMGLLRHLDKAKADELQQLIDSTIS